MTDQVPNTTIATILHSASEYVQDGWVQDMLAADEHMRPVEYDSPKARHWCAVAAVRLAASGYDDKVYQSALKALRVAVGTVWVADWNNGLTRTKDQIVSTMREVATKLSEGVVSVSWVD